MEKELLLVIGISFLSIYIGKRLGALYGILFLIIELALYERIKK